VTRVARLLAPAKVNLRLRVLGQRADGYHDLDTLFQAIDLTDEVSVALRGHDVRLDVRGPHGTEIGAISDNLAYRAAMRFARRVGFEGGIAVELTKRVPAGAGLGGGSSDAAAVLRCLATLLEISDRDHRVRATAEELGSDVPFFLSGSTLARGTGRGEIIEPLQALPVADLVLISPPVHLSTARAYAALSESRRGTTAPLAASHPPPGSWDDVVARASNDFEPVVLAMRPEIRRALDALADRGARFALMSGSGSSVFGLFSSRAESERVASALSTELDWASRAVRTLLTMPEPRVA
jgi:4-diphosphocytidyl-2-C-methyl-D-erythritol kinase